MERTLRKWNVMRFLMSPDMQGCVELSINNAFGKWSAARGSGRNTPPNIPNALSCYGKYTEGWPEGTGVCPSHVLSFSYQIHSAES